MDPIEPNPPIEEKPVELPTDSALEERVTALEAIVATLQTQVSQVIQKTEDVEEKVTEKKEILQVVFDKDADGVHVRQKVLVTVAGNSREEWEDVTNEYSEEELEEVIKNGA